MNYLLRLAVIIAFISSTKICSAQVPHVLTSAHSHNDYNQTDPFNLAYNRGFESIEADIFLSNNVLFVAHDKDKIAQSRTLSNLYLRPLEKVLSRDTCRKVTLLIDVKEDYHAILPELLIELKPLLKFVEGSEVAKRLTILISGNRPPPEEFENYPKYIEFDEDLLHTYTASQLKRIGQVSLQYTNYSAWKGIGPIPEHEATALQTLINAVHALGKPIRFWDAPDNAAGWTELIKLHADVIGTDNIDALSSFLKSDAHLSSTKP